MHRASLRIVPEEPVAEPRRSRVLALALAATLLVLGAIASLLGADEARRATDPRAAAARALEIALREGSEVPAVQRSLADLRRGLARRMLDGPTRVAYASLWVGIARTTDDLDLAAFHARLAARLAPVTVPVVRAAALVLLQTGHPEECSALVREMFLYDPGAASRLLETAEPLLSPDRVEQAIPEVPQAWIAWARQLRLSGREDEADTRLELGFDRWPDHLSFRLAAATRAAREGNVDALERLVPLDGTLPDEPAAAVLFVHRARLALATGLRQRATEDLGHALRLAGGNHSVLLLAGDVYRELGMTREARGVWNRALFRLDSGRVEARRGLLRRLARLEEADGRAGIALRHWRSLLELDPTDREASERVAALTGQGP